MKMSQTPYENADLKRERSKCSFNKDEITHLVDGGADRTKLRRQIAEFIISDQNLKDPIPMEYMSHADKYANDLRKACLLIQKLRDPPTLGEDDNNNTNSVKLLGLGYSVSSAVLKEGNPLGLHFVMFIPAIMGQGTPEQQEKWLPRAYNFEIIGTYAQTELGHGTFLKGLETTATYDPKTKEFIIDSPSLTAYKWWPGGLGKTANYAVVMAQLYTNGKCEGAHPFIVQIRDEETHEPMPGVVVGEIGPKLGFNSTDNGYLGFKKVRISRDQMLMKHSQVLEDGTYVKPVNTKLSYGTMVYVRVFIVHDMAAILRKASTIAVRYSCVRHQSQIDPDAPEPQIIEFQAQQNKLFPPLAASFAFHFAAERLLKLYRTANKAIRKGDLDLLPDLHGSSCALKALSSAETSDFVEVLRQSCGGHGYMSCSGFPRLYGLATASETYEGENTVLWLQVARYLVKTWTEKSGGQSVKYIANRQSSNKVDLSLGGLVDVFQKVSAGLVEVAVEELENCHRRGLKPHDAWNQSAVLLIRAAKAHARFMVAEANVLALEESDVSPPVRRVLTQLCELFLIYWITENNGDFVLYGNLTKGHFAQLQSTYSKLLAAIRHEAVNIVDAFDIRDEILGSALGCWDGNVYERLFEQASKSPLNATAVHHESYQNALRPLMKSNL